MKKTSGKSKHRKKHSSNNCCFASTTKNRKRKNLFYGRRFFLSAACRNTQKALKTAISAPPLPCSLPNHTGLHLLCFRARRQARTDHGHMFNTKE